MERNKVIGVITVIVVIGILYLLTNYSQLPFSLYSGKTPQIVLEKNKQINDIRSQLIEKEGLTEPNKLFAFLEIAPAPLIYSDYLIEDDFEIKKSNLYQINGDIRWDKVGTDTQLIFINGIAEYLVNLKVGGEMYKLNVVISAE